VTRPSLVGHGARVARREARAQLCETSPGGGDAVFFSLLASFKQATSVCSRAHWNHDCENVQQKVKSARDWYVKRDW